MEKDYRKALVIGKFQPLHKGHMAMIKFAADHAEHVVVCLTAHDGEIIPMSTRKKWLDETFNGCPNIIIEAIAYDANMLTDSSESNVDSSRSWADFLKCYFGVRFNNFDVIVGSERYVQYMADYLGISHLIYDEQRTALPISATMIKADILKYWDYLSPAVKHSFVKHVCICGSESTGKSTTCKRLDEQFDSVTMIPEIGRCLVGKSELCTQETLHTIYRIHNELLHAVVADPPTPVIVWDTDNLTTYSYYTFLFPEVQVPSVDIPKADKYFFFDSNIAFVDDGTRLSEKSALQLRNHHLTTYKDHGINPQLISCENRYDVVRQYIQEHIDTLKKVFRTNK